MHTVQTERDRDQAGGQGAQLLVDNTYIAGFFFRIPKEIFSIWKIFFQVFPHWVEKPGNEFPCRLFFPVSLEEIFSM